MRLTKAQKRALYALHKASTRSHGFYGVDVATLAGELKTSPEGAARTASSLVRRGLASRFVGGVGRRRTHYQAEKGHELCPHGCGLLDWVDDSWICNACGDEWLDETMSDALPLRCGCEPGS